MKINSGSYQPIKLYIPLIDYLFWILFIILYTDPGGIIEAFNLYYIIGKINYRDVLIVLLAICYVLVPKESNIFDLDYLKIKKYLLIFLFYYLIVFVIIVPILNGNKDYSLVKNLIKSRYIIYEILLFNFIYKFLKRRSDIFIKIFLFSSILISMLFLQGLITDIKILPVLVVNRGFININKHFCYIV